jgi:hypothetical protein
MGLLVPLPCPVFEFPFSILSFGRVAGVRDASISSHAPFISLFFPLGFYFIFTSQYVDSYNH